MMARAWTRSCSACRATTSATPRRPSRWCGISRLWASHSRWPPSPQARPRAGATPLRLADIVSRAGADRPQRAGRAAGKLARRARRDGAVGAAQAADRRAARRRVGAARQDGGGRDGGPRRSRDIEEVWHASRRPMSRLFAWLEGRAPEARRRARAGVPAADAVARAGGGRLGGAGLGGFLRRMEMGRHPRADRARRGETHLYSRTGDDIGRSFPDVVGGFSFDAVLDGELLVVRDGEVASFNDLQQRLNRKGVSQAAAGAVPGPRAPLRCAADRRRGPASAALARAPRAAGGLARASSPARTDLSPRHRRRLQGRAAAAVGGDARDRHRGHHAQAPRQPLCRRPAQRACGGSGSARR